MEAMYFLASVVVSPMAIHSLHATLLSSMFRLRQTKNGLNQFPKQLNGVNDLKTEIQSTKLKEEIEHEFCAVKRIPYKSYWLVKLSCADRRNRTKKYQSMVKKAHSRITKEMDFQKFLHRQRLLINSLLGLLKSRQGFFVDKHSKLIVRESTETEVTSQDDELNDIGPGSSMHFVGTMINSSNAVDRRLVKLFKLSQADHYTQRKETENPTPSNNLSQIGPSLIESTSSFDLYNQRNELRVNEKQTDDARVKFVKPRLYISGQGKEQPKRVTQK